MALPAAIFLGAMLLLAPPLSVLIGVWPALLATGGFGLLAGAAVT